MKLRGLRRLRPPALCAILSVLLSAVGCLGPVTVVQTSRLEALQSRPSVDDWDACEADRAVCEADLRACHMLGRRLAPFVQ